MNIMAFVVSMAMMTAVVAAGVYIIVKRGGKFL